MAHHKRRRPKHLRNGCYCKGWKDEREPKSDKYTTSEKRKYLQDPAPAAQHLKYGDEEE